MNFSSNYLYLQFILTQLDLIQHQFEVYHQYISTPYIRNLYLAQKKIRYEEQKIPIYQPKYVKQEIQFERLDCPQHFHKIIELIDMDIQHYCQQIKLRPNLSRLKVPLHLTKIYRKLSNQNDYIRRSVMGFFSRITRHNNIELKRQRNQIQSFSTSKSQRSIQQCQSNSFQQSYLQKLNAPSQTKTFFYQNNPQLSSTSSYYRPQNKKFNNQLMSPLKTTAFYVKNDFHQSFNGNAQVLSKKKSQESLDYIQTQKQKMSLDLIKQKQVECQKVITQYMTNFNKTYLCIQNNQNSKLEKKNSFRMIKDMKQKLSSNGYVRNQNQKIQTLLVRGQMKMV